MVTLVIEYFKDGVVHKPKYNITSAVAFFKKVAELRTQHIVIRIYPANELKQRDSRHDLESVSTVTPPF